MLLIRLPVEITCFQHRKLFFDTGDWQLTTALSNSLSLSQILLTNAEKYSKGLLSEILDFVMGTGLIPADGEVWKMRRRAIVPALHRK